MMHILFPTDFSDNSKHAIKYALKLFKGKACKFYFLHTYTPAIFSYEYQISAGLVGQDLTTIAFDNAKERLYEFALSIMSEEDYQQEFETIVDLSILSEAVKRFTKKLHIDLVIMGTKGATSSSDVILGTNAIHVINTRSCPVIVVPHEYNFNSLDTLFFPTDLNIEYTWSHMEVILELAKHHNSNIETLHIAFGGLKGKQKAHKEVLENIFQEYNYKFNIVEDKDIADAVYEYQNSHKTDLLVMINNKHLFFENIFFRPTISKIAMHLKTPFLVIPV